MIPVEGSIRFHGKELLDRQPHEIAKLGIARTFQSLHAIGRPLAAGPDGG